MNDQELKQLFSGDVPPSRAAEKQRSVNAAMAAFREEQKNLKADQGNTSEPRLTPESTYFGRILMAIQTHRITLAGMSSACLILVAVFALKDTVISEQPKLDRPATSTSEQRLELAKQSAKKDDGTSAETIVTLDEEVSAASPRQKEQFASTANESKAEVAEQELAAVIAERKPMREADIMERSITAAAPMEDKALSRTVVARNAASPKKIAPGMEPSALPELSEDRDRFKDFNENAVNLVSNNPVSTFSIDVDTAAYSYVRRELNRGVLPQSNAVRIEEMINYFDYQYPQPESKSQPFEPTIVVHDSPWKTGNKLVHIGIKGYDISAEEKPDSNIVFLLDVSGSMRSTDKLPLVKQSMGLLLDTLKPSDKVSIVVYAGAAGTVLEPTPVKNKSKILEALNRLQAGGSTAGAAGIALAYQLAEQNFNKASVNRVILATDGDFNVGVTEDERLEDFVARKRDSGIYLSVLGFGRGNYQDAMMQTLAQNGNGVAAYIDTLGEAQKVLVEEANSALFPIANDVKIQVEFNPAAVSEYRLIGYETRALKREDFNNDKVDAGDIGAGHTVTAIYEITPKGQEGAVDALRYQSLKEEMPVAASEYGFLKIRYKLPGEKQSQLIEKPILRVKADWPESIMQEVRFATAVAGFAQLLKGSQYVQGYDWDDAIKAAHSNKGEDEFGYRTEFVQLIRKAKVAKAL